MHLFKIIVLLYISFIVLVAQYPESFSRFFNNVYGKLFVLLLLLLLTNIDMYAGLLCTVIVILFYGFYNKPQYELTESFTNNDENTSHNKILTSTNREIDKTKIEEQMKPKNSKVLPIIKVENTNPQPFDNIYK